jgi:phage-related protein
MAKKTSIINVVVAGDSKPLRKALGKATQSLGNVTKQIGKFSVAAGAAFAGLGAKSIGLAVDFEESLSKANQIFGDAAKGIETAAKSAANEVGLSRAEFLEASSSFGVFGKAAGLTGDELSGFAGDLVTLSADVASFNNLRPEEALEKLNAGLRGSVEPLQSIGVLMNAAAVETEALNMGLIEQGEELSEGQKILARHSLIMQQLGEQGATGDFKRTSEGLANTQRILHARLKDLGITLGQVLLPIAEKMADVTGRLITKFEQWSPKIKDVFNKVKELLTPVKELAQTWLPIIARVVKDLVSETLIPALVTAFHAVKDAITDQVIPAFKALISFSRNDIPEAFNATIDHIKEYKNEYIALGVGVGTATTAILLFKGALKMGAAIKAATAGLAGLAAIFGGPFVAAGVAIAAIVAGLTYLALESEGFRNALGAVFDFLIEDTKEFIAGVQRAIGFVKELISFAKQVPQRIEEGVKNLFSFGSGESQIPNAVSPKGGLERLLERGLGFLGLADGGIITRPTLAMIGEGGEPEAVIPLSKMGGMGTMNITVNMPAGADGNDVVQALEDYVRRNGSIPLAVNNLVRK